MCSYLQNGAMLPGAEDSRPQPCKHTDKHCLHVLQCQSVAAKIEFQQPRTKSLKHVNCQKPTGSNIGRGMSRQFACEHRVDSSCYHCQDDSLQLLSAMMLKRMEAEHDAKQGADCSHRAATKFRCLRAGYILLLVSPTAIQLLTQGL